MAIINVYDRADELRIELCGEFAGACVEETSATWRSFLPDAMHRRLTVDISEVSNCDDCGRHLLREMYLHGTQIAARNPRALTLLNEITTPTNRKSSPVPERIQSRVSMTRSLRVSPAAAS